MKLPLQTVIAAIAVLAASQASAETLQTAMFKKYCADTSADPALAAAAVQADGFGPLVEAQTKALADQQKLVSAQGFRKQIGNSAYLVITGRQPTFNGRTDTRMDVCDVVMTNPDVAAASEVAAWVGQPPASSSETMSLYMYIQRPDGSHGSAEIPNDQAEPLIKAGRIRLVAVTNAPQVLQFIYGVLRPQP